MNLTARRIGGGDLDRHAFWSQQDFGDIMLPFFLAVSVFAGVDTWTSLVVLVPIVSLACFACAFRMFRDQDFAMSMRIIFFTCMALWILLFGFDSMLLEEEIDIQAAAPPHQEQDDSASTGDIFSWFELVFFSSFCLVSLCMHYWVWMYHLLPNRARAVFRRVFIHRLRWIESIPGPTALDVIDSLEILVVTPANIDALQCCSVCLEDFACGDRANKLRCSHVFHAQCLVPWLLMKNTCPVCRRFVDCADDLVVDVAVHEEEVEQVDHGPQVVWTCLQRIVDADYALDFRSETKSTLQLLKMDNLFTKCKASGVILDTNNKDRLVERLWDKLQPP